MQSHEIELLIFVLWKVVKILVMNSHQAALWLRNKTIDYMV